MSKISEKLILGDKIDAQDLYFLQENKITHIVVVCDTLKPNFPKDFEYLHIPFSWGDWGSDLTKYFKQAIDFIHKSQKCFIHCIHGKHRSPCFVLLYMVTVQNYPFDEALNIIRNRRPLVRPPHKLLDKVKVFAQQYRQSKNLVFQKNPELLQQENQEKQILEKIECDQKWQGNSYKSRNKKSKNNKNFINNDQQQFDYQQQYNQQQLQFNNNDQQEQLEEQKTEQQKQQQLIIQDQQQQQEQQQKIHKQKQQQQLTKKDKQLEQQKQEAYEYLKELEKELQEENQNQEIYLDLSQNINEDLQENHNKQLQKNNQQSQQSNQNKQKEFEFVDDDFPTLF